MARLFVYLTLLLVVGLAGLTACAWVRPATCVVCAKTLWERHGYVDLDGKRYAFHLQHVPKNCRYCGGLLAAHAPWGTGLHTKEGVDVCRRCDKDAVRDLRTAQALVRQVRADLVRLGLTLPWGTIPVTLRKPDFQGQEARTNAARRSNGSVVTLSMWFQPGMPRTTFKGTAAHELTHAWSYLKRCPLRQDEALSEGTANLVQYTYLERDQSPQAKYIRKQLMTHPHPHYGEGFRRMLRYSKGHRLSGALAVLKTNQHIPPGF